MKVTPSNSTNMPTKSLSHTERLKKKLAES